VAVTAVSTCLTVGPLASADTLQLVQLCGSLIWRFLPRLPPARLLRTHNADDRLRRSSDDRLIRRFFLVQCGGNLSASVSGQVSHQDKLFCAMTRPPLPVFTIEIFPFFFGVTLIITQNHSRTLA